jgi:mxaD protein
MKKITIFVSALVLFFTASVNAHGPVRAKQILSITIKAPADQVWEVIKNFDDMSWHPDIKSVDGDGTNKKGAVRILTLANGGKITEELKAYKEDKKSYKYKITDMSTAKTIQHSGQSEDVPVLPVNNYQATITVKDKGDKSEVTWVATYYRAYLNNNPPPEMDEDAADEAVKTVLTHGLISLAKKFDSNASESDVKVKIKR